MVRRRLRQGRGCPGLASHQWLLLIGAVAGMGALAIFVLANTVDDAVDRAGADDPARLASARRAALLVESEATTITPESWPLSTWGQWEKYFQARCENIETAYREHNIKVQRVTDPIEGLIVPIRRSVGPAPADPIIEDNPNYDPNDPDSKRRQFVGTVDKVLGASHKGDPAVGKPQVSCQLVE